MARTLAMRGAAPVAERDDDAMELPEVIPVPTDASLTSAVAHPLPARIVPPVPATYVDGYDSTTRVLKPIALSNEPEAPIPEPNFNSRAWREGAWKREKEREKRSASASSRTRRRSIA